MTRLDDLIAELCPAGVEFGELGDFAHIDKGEQLNLTKMSGDGLFPVMNGGINPSGYFDECNNEENTITVSQGGASAGYVNFLTTKFWAGAHCYVVKPKSKRVINKYLYYLIKNSETKIQESKYGAGIPGLNKSTLEILSIPIPPLPIQEEIVSILDTFTALEAELEAELEARTKQYEFYRDTLLNFDPENPHPIRPTRLNHLIQTLCPDGVEHSKILDICLPTETIDWIGNIEESFEYIDLSSVDRDNHLILSTTSIDSITAPSRAQRIVKSKDVIIGTTRPTLQRYCIIPDEYDGQICSTGFCVLRTNEDYVLPRYLYYQISNRDFWEHTEMYQRGSAYPAISDKDVKNFEISVPPLPVQEEIVAILDRFDALVNDLKNGLPAEIAARRKQYQYYRDQLLTFNPLP